MVQPVSTMVAWNDAERPFLESYATVYIASLKYTRQTFRPSYIVPSVVHNSCLRHMQTAPKSRNLD